VAIAYLVIICGMAVLHNLPIDTRDFEKAYSFKLYYFSYFYDDCSGVYFCIVVSHKWPSPVYYLLPTRTWEMMIGGTAFLCPLCIRDINKSFLLVQD
jgi:peptidoglycan/LPS O-acetylase OafA/YrhL